MYQLHYMAEPDGVACAATKQQQFVTLSTGERKNAATSVAFPDFIAHGTTIPNALEILEDGFIRVSDGIAGVGTYGFRLKSMATDDVLTAFKRTTAGGYNAGAMFILECNGILINGDSKINVPTGAVAYKARAKADGCQFACGPRTADYFGVAFNTEGLMSALGSYLEKRGILPRCTQRSCKRNIRLLQTPTAKNSAKW